MRTRSNMLAIALLLLAVMGSWVLFVGSFTAEEMILGAGFAVLSAAISFFAWHELGVRFSPSLKQLALLWRIPGYILRDTVDVTWVLIQDFLHVRRAGSLYRAVPFAAKSGAHGDAQVVLAITGTSMTPSIIILGYSDQRLLMHQLRCDDVPRMITELEKSA